MGRGNPGEPMDRWATAERSELGAMAEPVGQRAEAGSGPLRLETESWETLTTEGLPDDSSGGGRSGWEGRKL